MRYQKYLTKNTDDSSNSTAAIIKESAQKLFLSNGYESTTIRDIAAVAQVTPGLVMYHYKSKENLAKAVFTELRERIYDYLKSVIDFSALPVGERLYVLTISFWKFIDESNMYSDFFHSLLAKTNIGDELSSAFKNLTQLVIQSYGLKVTIHENNIYLTALVGAQKHLVLQEHFMQFDVNYYEIANLLISNYLYNIGLPDHEIAKIIENGSNFLEHLDLKVDLMHAV